MTDLSETLKEEILDILLEANLLYDRPEVGDLEEISEKVVYLIQERLRYLIDS